MKICVFVALDEVQKERIRAAVAPHEAVFCGGQADGSAQLSGCSDCEVAFGNTSPDIIAGMKHLRWIQLDATGFGEFAAIAWPSESTQVTRLEGFYADPVAESCLAGMMALLRGVNRCVQLQGRREWVGKYLRPELGLLSDAAVVLFGFGSINRRLAELLSAFRCRVTSFGSDWTAAAMDPCLQRADAVVCVAPGTPKTEGVFHRERLSLLPQSAIFVNAGRGSVVDEAALNEMLRAGRLAGAAIDVTVEEPLPADHPFWDCPNLILTQHSSGGFRQETDRKVEVFISNFKRFAESRPLEGVANIKRGY